MKCHNLLAATIGSALVSACASVPALSPIIESNRIEQLILSTRDSSLAEACDRRDFETKLVLARLVDKTNQTTKTQSNEQDTRKILMWGPIAVIDDQTIREKGSSETTYRSWESLWKSYRERGSVFKPSKYFRDVVDRTAWDDWRRLTLKSTAFVDRGNLDLLAAINRWATRCSSNLKKCSVGTLNRQQIRYLKERPPLAERFESFSAAQSDQDRENRMRDLAQAISRTLVRFSFIKNPSVKRLDGKTLELPLDGEELADGKLPFANALEKIWSNDRLKIVIKWVKRDPANADMFKIKMSNETSYYGDERELRIGPISTVRGLAHELGHVLGFPDAYYTQWDPRTCTYVSPSDSDGIMSAIAFDADKELSQLSRYY